MIEEATMLRNLGYCGLCEEVIESTHRHEMKWCSGQHFAVDGGLEYLKRSMSGGVDFAFFEERSEFGPVPKKRTTYLDLPAITVCDMQDNAAQAIRDKKYTPKLIGSRTTTDTEAVVYLAGLDEHDFEQAVRFGQVALVGKLLGMKRGALTRRVRVYKQLVEEECHPADAALLSEDFE